MYTIYIQFLVENLHFIPFSILVGIYSCAIKNIIIVEVKRCKQPTFLLNSPQLTWILRDKTMDGKLNAFKTRINKIILSVY